MADPLSAGASALTVLATCIECANQLREVISSIQHAPDELLSLCNEVNDLKLVMESMAMINLEGTMNNTAVSHSLPMFLKTLDSAKKTVGDLEEITDKANGLQSRAPRRARFSWLRTTVRVKGLQKELMNTRMRLDEWLTISTKYDGELPVYLSC